jgi:Na+-transporting NADH:ubiquinone oxidoreductase subunit B
VPPDPGPTVETPAKRRRLFMRQKAMRRMVYALVPVALSGVYFFGWRVAALLAVSSAVALATEYVTARRRGQPVSQAVFVTAWLLALALPPTTPLWIAGVGAFIAILFGKEVFGGFGRNFANPAIVGRAFVYVCFPIELTGRFVPAFRGWPGGLVHWSFEGLAKVPDYVAAVARTGADAVTAASPMLALRDLGYTTPWWDLFWGTIGGVFETPASYGPRVLAAGSIGEGCVPLIVLAGVYLAVTRTANWRLMVSPFIGAAAATYLVLACGARGVQPLTFKLLAGAFFYVSVFMITEPVSAPNRKGAMWAYGSLIGALIVILSWKGQFVAAASFSILLGNIVSPLLDMGARAWRGRKQPSGQAPSQPPAAPPAGPPEPPKGPRPAQEGGAPG